MDNFISTRACTQSAIIMMLFFLTYSDALDCHCTGCIDEQMTSMCTATQGACYIEKVSRNFNSELVTGCLSKELALLLCEKSDSGFWCCYDDRCNNIGHADRELRQINDGSATTDNNTSSSGDELRDAAIITVIVCLVTMTTIVSLLITAVCCVYYRKRKRKLQRRRNASEEIGRSNFRVSVGSYGAPDFCQAFLPQSESISSLLKASMFYGSALSLLVQRSIVQQTTLEKSIGKGSFNDRYIGKWRRDRVSVKVYTGKYERMWFNETAILQLPLMRHENILSFIAADIVQRNSQNYHYLISEHHPRGTLREYLVKTTIELPSMLTMVMSLANGLAYLHSDLSVQSSVGVIVKPAIAHRNISSQSVYVDNNGSCCWGDFSLSVKSDPNAPLSKVTSYGDVRYLPPEFLMEHPPQVEFESLRRADMYSLGLVLWEIVQRCLVQGMVEEYTLPFSDSLASTSETTPTLEEMRTIVCEQGERPPTADQCNRDQNTRVIVHTMHECWSGSPLDRPSSQQVKNSFEHQLSSGDKNHVNIDKNGQPIATHKGLSP